LTGARLSGFAGIVFALAFFASVPLLDGALGSFGDPDATFVEYYEDDHATEIIGGYVLAVAAIAFVVFVAGICAPAFDDARRRTAAVSGVVCAAVFAALLSAAAAAVITIPFSRFFGGIFDDEGQLVTEVAALPQLGYVLIFVPGALFASATIVCVALVMRGDAAFPRPVANAGFVAAAFLLAAFFFIPVFALPLWVLAASVALLRAKA
jgi:hypothetical protein